MTTYTCTGSVRGNCGHHHRTISTAVSCCAADQRGCKAQGGYSDRTIRAVEDGAERPLTEEEYLHSISLDLREGRY